MAKEQVVVGCKLPNGLHLDILEDAGGGQKRVKVRVTLNGSNHRDAIGGYGMTSVDADHYAAWEKEHRAAGFAPLLNDAIFVVRNENDARAKARENRDVVTGFEGLDPQKPGDGLKPENYEGMPTSKE